MSGGSGILAGYAGYSTRGPIIPAGFVNGRIAGFESKRGAEADRNGETPFLLDATVEATRKNLIRDGGPIRPGRHDAC